MSRYSMFNRAILCVLLFGTIMMSTGCMGFKGERRYLRSQPVDANKQSTWWLYLPNRVADLADVPMGSISFASGANVRLHATKHVDLVWPQPSDGLHVGWNTDWDVRLNDRLPGYLWKRYYPVTLGAYGGPSRHQDESPADDGQLRKAHDAFSLGFNLFIIGGEIGIRPTELVDFLTGWFLIDLHSDEITYTKTHT